MHVCVTLHPKLVFRNAEKRRLLSSLIALPLIFPSFCGSEFKDSIVLTRALFVVGTNKVSPSPMSRSEVVKMLNQNALGSMQSRNRTWPRVKCKCTECGPKKISCTSAEGCFVGQTYDFQSRRIVDSTFGCLHDKKVSGKASLSRPTPKACLARRNLQNVLLGKKLSREETFASWKNANYLELTSVNRPKYQISGNKGSLLHCEMSPMILDS